MLLIRRGVKTHAGAWWLVTPSVSLDAIVIDRRPPLLSTNMTVPRMAVSAMLTA